MVGKEVEQMIATSALFAEYITSQQDEKIADTYTEDCRIMGPGQDVKFGKQAILDAVKALRESGVVTFAHGVDQGGVIDDDTGYTTGWFKAYCQDGTEIGRGGDVCIWKKINGKYLCYVDCWKYDA